MNEPTNPVDGQANTDWIEPYYKMDKEELLNNVPLSTLNDIRTTLGDQEFIDQWKLSEDEYNKVVGEQEQPEPTPDVKPLYNPTTTTTTTTNEFPAQQVYTERPANVRRVYTSGYPSYSRTYYPPYYTGYPSYWPYHTYSYAAPVERVYTTTDQPITTSVVRNNVVGVDEPVRTSVTRVEPARRSYSCTRVEQPVTRVYENPLRSSYVAPVTTTTYVEPVATTVVDGRRNYPIGTSYVRHSSLPRTRYIGTSYPVHTTSQVLRSSRVFEPAPATTYTFY